MRKIYALLIGINDYPGAPLSGCVGDVGKMKSYLETLKSQYDTQIILRKCTNQEATKAGIVDEITRIINLLEDTDTFILYYSGHGTREFSEARFLDDHNGTLECIVPYHLKNETSCFLLADKEIRYLLNRCKSSAHIVTIFDSCHSGDITRAFANTRQIKRMSTKFPQRNYTDFIFGQEGEEERFQDAKFTDIYPDKNIITLSACQPHESSWEDTNGGVFTRNLIAVLKNSNNLINYNDIARNTEIAIRHRTLEKQTPVLSVQGDRRYNQLTSWLRLHGDQLKSNAGYITYNAKEDMGWVFSKGELMGVNEGTTIQVILEDENIELKVDRVNLNDAVLEVPIEIMMELDTEKTYLVNSVHYFIIPRINIHNIDNNGEAEELLKVALKNKRSIEFVDHWEQADFEINIFNNTVYFSFSNDPYRPLNMQINLGDKNSTLNDYVEQFIDGDLLCLTKWNHFKSMERHEGFGQIPIKVEIQEGNTEWANITNGRFELVPLDERSDDNQWYRDYKIRVTNLTDKKLYITPIVLFHGKLEISSYPFEERSEILEAGRNVVFNNYLAIDYYQEIYNWEGESACFKFLAHTSEDSTHIIPSIVQKGFEEPLTRVPRGARRGGGVPEKHQKGKWGVYTSNISLCNPSVNKITGLLKKDLNWYKQNETVWPFIEKLYSRDQSDVLTTV